MRWDQEGQPDHHPAKVVEVLHPLTPGKKLAWWQVGLDASLDEVSHQIRHAQHPLIHAKV